MHLNDIETEIMVDIPRDHSQIDDSHTTRSKKKGKKRQGQGSSLHFNFEWDDSTQYEIEFEQAVREMDGVPIDNDFSDIDSYYEGEVEGNNSRSEESFFSDHSNKDESDDDLILEKYVDDNIEDKLDSDDELNRDDNDKYEDVNRDEIDGDSTVYVGSDDKRMAAILLMMKKPLSILCSMRTLT